MTHKEIVNIVSKWLKRHERNALIPNCPLVVSELVSLNHTGEVPDVLGWSYCFSVVIEVKISHADFLADKNKRYRRFDTLTSGEHKYYCCPEGIIKVDELPDNWGLLYVVNSKIKIIKLPVYVEANLMVERTILLSYIRRQRELGLTDKK